MINYTKALAAERDTALKRLAEAEHKDYDTDVEKRKPADEKDGRILSLEDIEPWPESVDGAKLLDDISGLICRYVALSKYEDGDAVALWVLHAHAHGSSFFSPILALESPQKRCGKTTTLEIVSRLTPRPLAAANISPAALFRVIERDKPTMFVDEADTFLKGNGELRGLLNGGHSRTSAFVIRVVEGEPTSFSTWAPKCIALIGRLPDTLEDRAIVIELRRKLKSEVVQRFRADRASELTKLARMAARWVRDNEQMLLDADPTAPNDLGDRAADNWRPLLAIADAAGGEWPERARKAASTVSGDGAGDEDPSIRMLADCKQVFDDHPYANGLQPVKLLNHLLELEDAPWREWRLGKPLTTHSLAKLLKGFKIKSVKPTRNLGPSKERYYLRMDFEDAWSRYITAAEIEEKKDTPSQPASKKASQPFHASQGQKNPNGTETYGGTESDAYGQGLGRDSCGDAFTPRTDPKKY